MFPRFSDLINYLFGTELSFPGYTYGFMAVLASAVAFFIVYLELKRRGNSGQIPADSQNYFLNIMAVTVLSSLVGIKLFHILDHWSMFIKDPFGELLSLNGLSYYGGLIFGGFAAIIYARKIMIPLTHSLDMVALANLIGYAIGRLGCQLSGDGCWGIPNTIPKPGWLSFLPAWAWAYNYPHNVINEGVRISDYSGEYGYILPVPVFPTPLYESLLTLIAFIILWSFRKKILIPGWLFSFFLITCSICRFLIEFLRTNPKFSILTAIFSQAQHISIMLFLVGVFSLWYFKRKPKGITIQQKADFYR